MTDLIKFTYSFSLYKRILYNEVKMKLRLKILSGFFILVVMLAAAAAWSIYELKSIGFSVNDLMEDNYKSIDASKTMIEALEREDSGVLLLILGKWEEGRKIIDEADKQFQHAFNIASNNLTIEGEGDYIKKIREDYIVFKEIWEKPIVGTSKEGDINWYFENAHQAFLDVKFSVNELMSINDRTMFSTASSLREQANRALMPAIIAIISALVFSLLFNYFVNYYFVNPIMKIKNGVVEYIEKKKPYSVEIESKDELTSLNRSISTLCSLSEANRDIK